MAVPPTAVSLCAVADIISKPEGLKMVKECLTSCRALRLHSSRGGAGLYPAPSSQVVLTYSATNRITVFRTARKRALRVGKKEMDVRG